MMNLKLLRGDNSQKKEDSGRLQNYDCINSWDQVNYIELPLFWGLNRVLTEVCTMDIY